jgi:hypothetical protein
LREFLELLNLPLVERGLMIFFQKLILNCVLVFYIVHLLVFTFLLINIYVEAALVSPDKVNHIHISSVNVLEHSLTRVNSNSNGFVDTNCFHTVSRLHKINQVFIGAQMHCVRSFSFGDRLRCLLKLYMLLVREETRVMYHLERIASLAVITVIRLKNATTLNKLIFGKATVDTFECSFLHFRDDIAVTNNNTLD